MGTSAAALLAGCAGGHKGSVTPLSTIAVHVGLFGGPLRPDGGMAESNAPQPDATVTVLDDSGRRWSAKTGQDGVASVSVPAGQYTVSSVCGSPQRVTVLAGKRAYVQLTCAIP